MSEKWKPIKGYKGLYEVSNLGRVRSLDRTVRYCDGRARFYKSLLLPIVPNKAGYVQVDLYKNSKGVTAYVHRLVMQTFKSPLKGKTEVNHKNGIKHDNKLSNLEWCSSSENSKHALETGLITAKGSNCHNSILSESDVLSICSMFDSGEFSTKQIAAKFKITPDYALEIRRGDKWNWFTDRKDTMIKIDKCGDNNPTAKSVVNCRGEVFGSAKSASDYYNIDSSAITKVCRNKRLNAGKYLNGEPIHWFYNT